MITTTDTNEAVALFAFSKGFPQVGDRRAFVEIGPVDFLKVGKEVFLFTLDNLQEAKTGTVVSNEFITFNRIPARYFDTEGYAKNNKEHYETTYSEVLDMLRVINPGFSEDQTVTVTVVERTA